MKKTLLIAAAALAVATISAQAQVYSLNIVGYVNIPTSAGFVSIANPLDNSTGNNATNLFDTTSGNNDGSELYLWGGTRYVKYVFKASSPTGFKDGGGVNNLPSPTIAPGQGFLFNNQNDPVVAGGSISNLTFTGTVHVDAAATGTQVVGTTTNIISGTQQYVFIASKLPIAGGVQAVLGITNNVAGDLDGSTVLVPNIDVNGVIHGYTTSVFKFSSPTGFRNGGNTANVPEPIIPVGGGFLFSNQAGFDYGWIQSL